MEARISIEQTQTKISALLTSARECDALATAFRLLLTRRGRTICTALAPAVAGGVDFCDWLNAHAVWVPGHPDRVGARFHANGLFDVDNSEARYYIKNIKYLHYNAPTLPGLAAWEGVIHLKRLAEADDEVVVRQTKGIGGWRLDILIRHRPGDEVASFLQQQLAEVLSDFQGSSTDELDALPLSQRAKDDLRRAGVRSRAEAIAFLIGIGGKRRINRATLGELRRALNLLG